MRYDSRWEPHSFVYVWDLQQREPCELEQGIFTQSQRNGCFFQNTRLHNWVGDMLKIKHTHKEHHLYARCAWSAVPQGSKQTLYSGIWFLVSNHARRTRSPRHSSPLFEETPASLWFGATPSVASHVPHFCLLQDFTVRAIMLWTESTNFNLFCYLLSAAPDHNAFYTPGKHFPLFNTAVLLSFLSHMLFTLFQITSVLGHPMAPIAKPSEEEQRITLHGLLFKTRPQGITRQDWVFVCFRDEQRKLPFIQALSSSHRAPTHVTLCLLLTTIRIC